MENIKPFSQTSLVTKWNNNNNKASHAHNIPIRMWGCENMKKEYTENG